MNVEMRRFARKRKGAVPINMIQKAAAKITPLNGAVNRCCICIKKGKELLFLPKIPKRKVEMNFIFKHSFFSVGLSEKAF